AANPSLFPCMRQEWYLTPPSDEKDEPCEINTSILAADIRSYLRNANISLDNFAKNYLLRSQGTLSDLLNHPKPWHDLSARGREIYIKMMKFLNAQNLKELVAVLKQANVAVRPGPSIQNIPSDVMELLKSGRVPSDQRIAEMANSFDIDVDYLTEYCLQQSQRQSGDRTLSNFLVFASEELLSQNNLSHRRHKDKRICPQPNCGVILGSKVSLDNHLVAHSGIRPYTCDQCGQTFTTNSNLLSHQRRHDNSSAPNRANKRSVTAHNALMVNSRKTTEDSLCDFAEVETSVLCKISFALYSPPNVIFRLDKHSETTVTVKSSHHLRTNHQNNYVCPLCKSNLRTSSALQAHLKRRCTKQVYKCDICGKHFKSKFNSLRHARTHTGSKPFKCPLCPTRFTESGSITAHLRTHTGEKPYECNECGKQFSQKGPLTTHMSLHNGSRPYLCEVCGKSFSQKTNLSTHEERHRGVKEHKCLCPASFQYKSDLQRHTNKHNKERPYQCKLCPMDFTRLQYLKEHHNKMHETPETQDTHSCNLKCRLFKTGKYEISKLFYFFQDIKTGVVLPVLPLNDDSSNLSNSKHMLEANPGCADKEESGEICCISRCMTDTSISRAMASDVDPTLSSSTVGVLPNDALQAVAIVTENGLMLTNNASIDLLDLSKLEHDVDRGDMHSVFVTPNGDEARYVVVNVARDAFP
uniref:Zinc finger protein n=1 Tax=Ciona savignyi TaxID=51511 RepID=H2ZH47_CIOSA